MKKTRQRSSVCQNGADQEAHLTNKVKFAIDLISKSRGQIYKSRKTLSLSQRKHFSQPKAQGRQNIKRRSKKLLKQQPQFEKVEEQIITQKGIWKMNNEFKEGIISWSNYILIPNPKTNENKFLCGQCKCVFLKIVEFAHHCIQICGEIHHIESSHFIINQHCLSNSLYDQLLYKESTKKQKLDYKRQSRSKTTVKQFNEKINKPKPKIRQSKRYRNIFKNLLQKQSNRQDTDKLSSSSKEQKINLELQSQQFRSMSKKQSNIFYDFPSQENESSIINIPQKRLESRGRHGCLKPKPFSKSEEAKFLNEKVKKIKQLFKQINQTFKAKILETQFIININYVPIFPSFVFVVNPLQNKIKSLQQNSNKCILKLKLCNFIYSHLMERCCEINSSHSIYLILWSEDFYRILYQRQMTYRSLTQKLNEDIAYWKYLYENTPLVQQMDMKYPFFKYYLGYIHIFIHYKSIIKFCRFCNNTFPGDFIKDCFTTAHKTKCKILKKKRVLFSIKNSDTVRQYTEDVLNIERIESCMFFCPCQSLENQMNIEELMEHTIEKHKKPYIIDIGIFFKKINDS